MRRSLGNFFTIRDVLARYAPTSLRLMLQGTHYRAAINYTQRALEEASDRAYYVYQTLADIDEAVAATPAGGDAPAAAPAAKPGKKAPPPGPAEEAASAAAALPAAVASALADDLNTPQALAALSAPLKAANDLLTTKAGRKARAQSTHHAPRVSCVSFVCSLARGSQAAGRVGAMRALAAALRDALDALGLSDSGAPAAELSALRVAALARAGLTEADIAAQIEARRAARAAGDYGAGDAIRDALAARGVALMDGVSADGGTVWRPAVAPTVG